MRQGFGSKVAVTTAVTLSTGSFFLGYWLLRRFRRRLNQSQFLRNGPVSHPDAAKLALGDYVRVSGTVSAGARTLTSPLKGVPCVAYRVNVVRVVDSRCAKEKASVAGVLGSLGGLSSFIPRLFSFTSTAEVEKEKWDTVYQVISTQGETVEIYLDKPEHFANLEAVAHAGIGTRRPRVRVDLASAEFFSMEEVMSDFKADESMESKSSSRTHLGYKTTEEVLAVGSKITVLGEVGPDPEGTEGDVLLRKASPASIFDLKTTSISRPFVVSTKTEQALLEEIEGSGRAYFWLAMPSIAVGLALAYFSVGRVVAAADDRRPFEGHRVTATVAGRSVPEPPRGLSRWRRAELR